MQKTVFIDDIRKELLTICKLKSDILQPINFQIYMCYCFFMGLP